ncbi:YraN family protein [Deinococcus misasensis]|uniref:YraN family protein n=1 Tax=Deinococcus misasensis TaxID=392413 RepID=UPI000558CD9F|nr:YraN family protein [Deinococcus misasensis]
MKGQDAEDRALQHLLQQGHVLLVRNFRIRGGEIDLITRDPAGTVVFTEVKHRTGTAFGHPLETITSRKGRLLWRAALRYLGRDDVACRFDAISITGKVDSGPLEHFCDVLQDAGF